MLKFHPLAITHRHAVADDAFALTFAVPAALSGDFRFRAGQHLALRAVIEGREERRIHEGEDELEQAIGALITEGKESGDEQASGASPPIR